jgi:hypothetical protein
MASWDSGVDVGRKPVALRCLACGRGLDEPLAVVGSLRCLDCRAANAALNQRFVAAAEQAPDLAATAIAPT